MPSLPGEQKSAGEYARERRVKKGIRSVACSYLIWTQQQSLVAPVFFNGIFRAPLPLSCIACSRGQLTGRPKNWQGRGGQTAGAGKGR